MRGAMTEEQKEKARESRRSKRRKRAKRAKRKLKKAAKKALLVATGFGARAVLEDVPGRLAEHVAVRREVVVEELGTNIHLCVPWELAAFHSHAVGCVVVRCVRVWTGALLRACGAVRCEV